MTARDSLELELKRLIGETTRQDPSALTPDADLVAELGLDSLAGLRLLAAVEKRYQIRFPDRRLDEFRTLGQIADFIAQASAAAPDAASAPGGLP